MNDTVFRAINITCGIIIMITSILQYVEMRKKYKEHESELNEILERQKK